MIAFRGLGIGVSCAGIALAGCYRADDGQTSSITDAMESTSADDSAQSRCEPDTIEAKVVEFCELQSTGDFGDEAMCTVPTAADECVVLSVQQANDACDMGCEAEFFEWFACVTKAAPVCNGGDGGCGIAKGLWEVCCDGSC